MPKATSSRPATPASNTGGGSANAATQKTKIEEAHTSAPPSANTGSFAASTQGTTSSGSTPSNLASGGSTHASQPMLWFNPPQSTRSSFQFNNWPHGLASNDPSSLGSLGSLSQRQSVDETAGVFSSLASDPTESLQNFQPQSSGSSSTSAAGSSSTGGSSGNSFSQGLPINVHNHHSGPQSSGSGSFSLPPSMLSQHSHHPHHGSGSISQPFLGLPFFTGDTRSGMGGFLTANPSDPSSSSNPSISGMMNDNGEIEHIGGEPRGRAWSFSGHPAMPGFAPGPPPHHHPSHHPQHPSHTHRGSGQASVEGMPHFPPFPYYYPMEQINPFARPTGSISGASTRSDVTEESRGEDPTSDTTAYAAREEDEGGEEVSDMDSYDDEEEDSNSASRNRRGTRYRRSGGTRARIVDDGEGSGHLSRHHRGTGRKKIDIQLIPTKLKRQITFSKRKTGLLKKVRELTTLTGTEAFVVLVSETGNPHSFATKKFQELIRSNNMKELNSYLDAEEKRKSKSGSRHR